MFSKGILELFEVSIGCRLEVQEELVLCNVLGGSILWRGKE